VESSQSPPKLANLLYYFVLVISIFVALFVTLVAMNNCMCWIAGPAFMAIALQYLNEHKEHRDPRYCALLLSPFIICAAMLAIGVFFPYPSHPSTDSLSLAQRETLTIVTVATSILHFAWLIIIPFLYPGRKRVAVFNSIAIFLITAPLSLLVTLTVFREWNLL
jgi:hypothetical protein